MKSVLISLTFLQIGQQVEDVLFGGLSLSPTTLTGQPTTADEGDKKQNEGRRQNGDQNNGRRAPLVAGRTWTRETKSCRPNQKVLGTFKTFVKESLVIKHDRSYSCSEFYKVRLAKMAFVQAICLVLLRTCECSLPLPIDAP